MKGRCPTCKKGYEVGSIDELPAFPFCSERCRLIDLGRWADGTFVIPGPEIPADKQGAPGAEDDEDD